MVMEPKVFILVLNWNGKDHVLGCLDSLKDLEYKNFEIAVVDNGSVDGSERATQELYPNVNVIQNRRNLGYAEGNNRGIQSALENGADYIFLVNNDTRIHQKCLTELVKAAEENSNVGILGPIAFDYETGRQPLDSGFRINFDLPGRSLIFEPISRESMSERANNVFKVDFVQGDAFFVRKTVFKKIGLFDQRFFLLNEEADFCIRARNAGFDTAVVKSARFQRMNSPTVGKNTPLRSYYATRNTFLFVSKHTTGVRKRRSIIQILKKITWDIKDYYLPNLFRTKDFTYFKNILAILHGSFDFFIKKFGRVRIWKGRVNL